MISGVHLWDMAETTLNCYTLLNHCEDAMLQAANKCGDYGGSTDCHLSLDGGDTWAPDEAGKWTYFLQMGEAVKDPCDGLNFWGDKDKCTKWPCEGNGGWCDGQVPS